LAAISTTQDEAHIFRALPVATKGDGAGVGTVPAWKYSFPLGARQPVDDICVHCALTERSGAPLIWTGFFECARGRHLEILTWPEANAIVIAAMNALYIVNPNTPDRFIGFAAPIEIDGVAFDESGRHMFAAESLRVYCFSSDHLFRWISEPLDGYGAHLLTCRQGVLLVRVLQYEQDPDRDSASSLIRLRAEDGTLVRSRLHMARFWRRGGATSDPAARQMPH
jgi:hypothetical protein